MSYISVINDGKFVVVCDGEKLEFEYKPVEYAVLRSCWLEVKG